MRFSRRDLFRQLFSRQTLQKVNPLPIQALEELLLPPQPRRLDGDCEKAGLALATQPRKRRNSYADIPSAVSPDRLGNGLAQAEDAHFDKPRASGAPNATGV